MKSVRWHGGPKVSSDAPTVPITFINPHPSERTNTSEEEIPKLTVEAKIGETLLQTAQRNHIDLEGACEGVCACSTCHLIIDDDLFDTLSEPSEDEEDMLDMAFGLTMTSRLGCQVKVSEEFRDTVIKVPEMTRNFYVDGHVPQGH